MITSQTVTGAPRLKLALRAGVIAYAVASLVIASALAPYWAGHTEFPGHEHPPGTPEHTHQLQDVTGSLAVSDVLTAVTTVFPHVLTAVILLAVWIRVALIRGANLSRAPPVTPVC